MQSTMENLYNSLDMEAWTEARKSMSDTHFYNMTKQNLLT
jgi:hypothetical protein